MNQLKLSSFTMCNTNLSSHQRLLNLSAFSESTSFSTIEIDFTTDCNLNCIYCYKHDKNNIHISREIAFDAVIWALKTSSPSKQISIALMGGEPLLNFSLIKEWVPFAIRRAHQECVHLSITLTTNCTLVSDEIIEFWKTWGLHFHTSIDGTPEVQNINRPTISGTCSAKLVEAGAIKILKNFPQTTARCTVTPLSVHALYDSYLYFRSLGYLTIAMVPSGYTDWDNKSIKIYKEQLFKIADIWMDEIRAGINVDLKSIYDYLTTRGSKSRTSPCGAGNELVSIDVYGNIWGCTRLTKFEMERYCFGNIYSSFNQENQNHFQNSQRELINAQDECYDCIANGLCQNTCPAEHLECIGALYGRHNNRCEICRVQASVGEYIYQTLLAEKNQYFATKYCSNDMRNNKH
jgi:uncharacterized protein